MVAPVSFKLVSLYFHINIRDFFCRSGRVHCVKVFVVSTTLPSCRGPGFLRYDVLRGFLELELYCFGFTALQHTLAK